MYPAEFRKTKSIEKVIKANTYQLNFIDYTQVSNHNPMYSYLCKQTDKSGGCRDSLVAKAILRPFAPRPPLPLTRSWVPILTCPLVLKKNLLNYPPKKIN